MCNAGKLLCLSPGGPCAPVMRQALPQRIYNLHRQCEGDYLPFGDRDTQRRQQAAYHDQGSLWKSWQSNLHILSPIQNTQPARVLPELPAHPLLTFLLASCALYELLAFHAEEMIGRGERSLLAAKSDAFCVFLKFSLIQSLKTNLCDQLQLFSFDFLTTSFPLHFPYSLCSLHP